MLPRRQFLAREAILDTRCRITDRLRVSHVLNRGGAGCKPRDTVKRFE
jgi:hypothetical protein